MFSGDIVWIWLYFAQKFEENLFWIKISILYLNRLKEKSSI